MPQPSPVYFWEALTTIKVRDLCFSLEAVDEGRGGTKKRIFSANWCRDEKIYFNPSKRLGGWLKRQLPLIRSSYGNQVGAIKVYPVNDDGEFIPIADLSELTINNAPLPDSNYELKQGLPIPMYQRIQVPKETGVGTRSTTTYWLELHKELNFTVRIISFARALEPRHMEEALCKLGQVIGIGDKYSQGFGRFTLIKFESTQQRMNL